MFNPSVIWTAFQAAGMLVEVQPASGAAFKAGFRCPDQIDGMAHTTDYTIEYQTDDAALKRGDTVTINNQQYNVRQPPLASGDGYFSVAYLEKK